MTITRHSSCLRKVRYSNSVSAREAANLMEEKHGNYSFKIYECNFCNGWHVAKSGISKYLRDIKYV